MGGRRGVATTCPASTCGRPRASSDIPQGVLRPLFGHGRPEHVDRLTAFTVESSGGEARFTGELGFQHLVDVHPGLRIPEEQRERFVTLYLRPHDEADLPADPDFRAAVAEHVDFGSRVAMHNSLALDDAGLHPLRQVPRWRWAGEGGLPAQP